MKEDQSRASSARQKADAAATKLQSSGWRTRSDTRFGIPLEALLRAAADHNADALIVGARTTKGLKRALLGSVAAGALNHSRIPVLVVP